MSLEIVHPSSVDEAIAWLAASPPLLDSPTQHRFRRGEHLDPAFAHGQRRPEWVWAAREDGSAPLAVVAGLGRPNGMVLDHFGARDPAALAAVVRAATVAAREAGEAEVSLYAPAGLRPEAAEAQPLVSALHEAGWQLLVERCHYEFTPAPEPGRDVATSLRLEGLNGPEDPRLLALQWEIMRATLDAHDQLRIERDGLEAATREAVADLLAADPWECVRLAFAGESGGEEPVGYTSWQAMPSGRGYLAFVGVARSARGHGFGRQLVALATIGLIEEGASTLIADTDRVNHPMVRAFADAGWPQTETRLDFTPMG